MLVPWKKSDDKSIQCIKKQRHDFADNGQYSQRYGFSNIHIWMWELTIKKDEHHRISFFELRYWRGLLKVLDCKEIQPVNPKGNQWTKLIHWKDWCWSWIAYTLATWWEETTHWKRRRCWERLRAGREGGDRGWDGWMVSLTQWTWVWTNSGR